MVGKHVCIIVSVVMIGLTAARQENMSFDNCLSFSNFTLTRHGDENTRYLLTWNGEPIRQHSCIFGYFVLGSVAGNKYAICIQATDWILNVDNITLNYYSDSAYENRNLQKTYTKHSSISPMTEWCSNSYEYVYVELYTPATSADQGRITLNIYPILSFNFDENLMKFLAKVYGSVFGSLAVICIVIAVIVIIKYRRKSRAGVVLNMFHNSGSKVTNQQSGFANTQGNVDIVPPSYNNATYNQDPESQVQITKQPVSDPLQNTEQPAPVSLQKST